MNDESLEITKINEFEKSSYFETLKFNLFLLYNLSYEEFKLFFYAGGDSRHHFTYWLMKMNGVKKPTHTSACICGHYIQENCYVTRALKDIVVVMGNCCIKRFIPGGMSKTCEICGKPHKNRKNDKCKECRKDIKDKNKLEKQIIKQRNLHGVYIQYDDYKPLPVSKYELSNRDRRWFNELQDLEDSDNEYIYDEYLKEYKTINKEPLKCKCSYEDTELFHYENTCFYERVII